ncbi:MAG: NADH:flavin oxidoreductase, partial [Synergistaceae bacterium]|nr:NADH:flavin oxidoreductase [Synergistaceae bacterium]
RMRLLREIYSDMRAAVGVDFPVWLKLSMAEGTPDGYTADEGLEVAKTLLSDGADGLEVSYGATYAGAQHSPSVIGVSAGESEAPFEKYAVELKKIFDGRKLIILTGGLRSLDFMAGLIKRNSCDLLGISRPLIAEPDLINRWAEEDSRPSACLSCNACFKTSAVGAVGCPIIIDRNEGNWDPIDEC